MIIDNQGAGYPVKSTGISTATITFVNDPRDTVGSGASIQLAATGTGQMTGLYPSNYGFPGAVVPTLTFSVGGAAATVLMNFTVTAIASGATNTATYATGTTPLVTTAANLAAATATFANPLHQGNVTFPRPARIQAGLAASNVLTGTGSVIEDGGFGIQGLPTAQVIGQLLAITGVTGNIPLGSMPNPDTMSRHNPRRAPPKGPGGGREEGLRTPRRGFKRKGRRRSSKR